MALQRAEEFLMVCLYSGCAGHHDEIQTRQVVLVEPEGFPADTLDPVAISGFPDVPLRDGQTQSRRVEPVGSSQNAQKNIGGFRGLRENQLEVFGLGQPQRPGESVGREGQAIRRSDACDPWRGVH